ncbi:hypothetical protein ABZX88_33075 [Kitasatospora aureofaciens]|uniref:hypothetical protein n=1 Tax=Kitasatospora aureofaciens TaxID=1894 RepID=UPI0033B530DF
MVPQRRRHAPDGPSRAGRRANRQIVALDPTASAWLRVSGTLQEAQSAARRTTSGDAASDTLWWYIALLHLDHAHALWKDSIGPALQR